MRLQQRQQHRHVGRVERSRQLRGRRHAPRLRADMGRYRFEADLQADRPLGAGGRARLERRESVERQPRPHDLPARHTLAAQLPGEAAGRPPAGSVRPQVVAGQPVPGVGRQRQPSLRVEPEQRVAHTDVHGARGCREGDSVVAAPARIAGQRRRHCRQEHPLLEHVDRTGDAVRGHRVAGLQFGLVQAFVRASQHARLLAEPDPRVEVPHPNAGGQADRPLVPGAVSGDVTGRRVDSDGRRRRDAAFLERFLQNQIAEGVPR